MNQRRTFLQKLGLMSAGFVVAPAFISCNFSEQPAEDATAADATSTGNANGSARANLNAVGIQLYTLRELLPNDVKGVIEKVAQAGYQDVETYGYSKERGFWDMEPKVFSELLKANGLISSSGHYDFGKYIETGDTEIVKTIINAGSAIGNTYITVPYLGEQQRSSADDYKKIAERLNKAGELCRDAKLQLAYHNHDFELNKYGDTTGYDILLDETDPSLVSFEADIYWFARGGQDPVAYFKKYPGRFVMWHVKDMDKNSPNLNTEVGSGSINYKEIVSHAELAGLQRIFVEQENFAANMDPFKSIAQSYNYVRNELMQ